MSTPRIKDIEKIVHEGKINTPFATVPFTTIVNQQGQPRKMADLTQNLKVSMGVERIVFSSFRKLDTEFGADGKPVFELSNKDARVRIVGAWTVDNGQGTSFRTITPDDYIEVTFYGTGLNLLGYRDTLARTSDIYVNGVLGITVGTANGNSVLSNRPQGMNLVTSLTSGLTLGWHTVRIQKADANQNFIYGCEIINEATQLTVNQGQPFQGGLSAKLDIQTLLAYKPTDIVGAKGGRVVTYITDQGIVGQATTETDVTALYSDSTNHINEDKVRTINFREFGKNRADDFSTLGASNSDRAYTLADGTTTLKGHTLFNSGESFFNNADGAETVFTFVGTGADVIARTNGTIGDFKIQVNGAAAVDLPVGASQAYYRPIKLASGLPYGTHTIKILRVTGGNYNFEMRDFVIYQPKKPTLPKGVIELNDYNVMADYVANTTTDGNYDSHIPTGTLRKQNIREFSYGGTWSTPALNIPSISGWDILTSTTNDTLTYSFYGTGFEFRFDSGSGTSVTVEVDGSSNLSGFTTSVYGGTSTFNAATGNIGGDGPANSGVEVSGLALGFHTVVITHNNTVFFSVRTLDIITPIHSNNTKVGSLSMTDLRSNAQIEDTSKGIDMTRAKALLHYDGTANTILSSMNISAVLDKAAGDWKIYFKKPFKSKEDMMVMVTSSQNGNTMVAMYRDDEVFMNGSSSKNYVEVVIWNVGAAATSDSTFNLVVFGELENEEDIDLGDL